MKQVLYFFGQLNDSDVDWLAQVGDREQLSAGSQLIEKDVEIDAVYVILDGHFRVEVNKGEALAQLGSGEIMGEMSMVDSRPPSATVTALDDARVLKLPHDEMEMKLTQDTKFASRFYRGLSMSLTDRMRKTMMTIDKSATQDDVDELSPELLDTLHLAGARFQRMLKKIG